MSSVVLAWSEHGTHGKDIGREVILQVALGS
jgi:hypothetical protein